MPPTPATAFVVPRPAGAPVEGDRLVDLPAIDDPGSVTAADARAMSKVLFDRLRVLEEGTHEYQYVRNTLIELNVPLVRFVVGRFRARPETTEEMVQVGTIGLIKAIDRFDPSFDVEFPTFAVPTISGEIKRFFRDTSWAVHVPRRLQELRLELAKARDAFTAEHDRAPTPAELADRLGIGVDEVVDGLTAAAGYTAASLDAPAGDDGPAEVHTSRAAFVDPGYELAENLHDLKPLVAALPQRDRDILSMRFGQELTQSQIGERLGISQMHVSRLLARTLSTLRAQLLAD
ncbi:SigB/SigF/SigG family RNA polymerase sigma factor [Streptomyces sp. SID3343]|uniref:SigB/SigF/SigG family RNA polymerase sigma factor n=1 Tax=Streptomyces sp. SID3343 TaxID=2690260 RepID=UPI00137182E3|nr:SigB/SigF/SigG family RNA polymerase sigma factor [Streptomyces sp. SID3343]MYW04968.1 SigB/SigF/SigG family RNA polymerase sigma factor [Streptomyces sp. SID3343]